MLWLPAPSHCGISFSSFYKSSLLYLADYIMFKYLLRCMSDTRFYFISWPLVSLTAVCPWALWPQLTFSTLQVRSLSSASCVTSARGTTRPWSNICAPTMALHPTSAPSAWSTAPACLPCKSTWRATSQRTSHQTGGSRRPICTCATSDWGWGLPRVGLGLGSGVGKHKDGMHAESEKGGMFTFLAAGLGKTKLKEGVREKNVLKYGGVVML